MYFGKNENPYTAFYFENDSDIDYKVDENNDYLFI